MIASVACKLSKLLYLDYVIKLNLSICIKNFVTSMMNGIPLGSSLR